MATTIETSNYNAAYKPQISLSGNTQASSQQKLNNLYQQIDTDGKGHITPTQFENSFSKLGLPANVKVMGSEAVLTKLDPNGTGVITKPEFFQRMESLINQKAAPPTYVGSTSKKPEPPPFPTAQGKPYEINLLDGLALGNNIDTSA
jgi:hypothetical protein